MGPVWAVYLVFFIVLVLARIPYLLLGATSSILDLEEI